MIIEFQGGRHDRLTLRESKAKVQKSIEELRSVIEEHDRRAASSMTEESGGWYEEQARQLEQLQHELNALRLRGGDFHVRYRAGSDHMLQVSPEGRILLHELILRRDAADARIDDVLIEQGIATKRQVAVYHVDSLVKVKQTAEKSLSIEFKGGIAVSVALAESEELLYILGSHMRRFKLNRVRQVRRLAELQEQRSAPFDRFNPHHERLLRRLWSVLVLPEAAPLDADGGGPAVARTASGAGLSLEAFAGGARASYEGTLYTQDGSQRAPGSPAPPLTQDASLSSLFISQRGAGPTVSSSSSSLPLGPSASASASSSFPPRLSEQWKQLGFQNRDPGTDFRGMGLLGLELLVHYAEGNATRARDMCHGGRTFPFAVAGINVAHALCQLFNLTDDLCLKGASDTAWDSPALTFASYHDHENVFEELFMFTLDLLDQTVTQQNAGYMDFQGVLKQVVARVRALLDRRPLSMDELRSLVEWKLI